MIFFSTFIGYSLGGVLLLIILVLVLIQSLFRNQKLFDPVIKFLCRLFPAAFGIKVNAVGIENVDQKTPNLFMANHVNIFDGFILYGYIPGFIRGIELEEHFSWPVWGTIVRNIGNIPISHTDPKSALKSLEKAGAAISNGTSIAILPEGHRTRDGKLQSFMRGPFRLAKNANIDIIPIVMKGLWERKTIHSKLVRPGTVELIFGNPIRSEFYKELSDRKLKDLVRDTISGML